MIPSQPLIKERKRRHLSTIQKRETIVDVFFFSFINNGWKGICLLVRACLLFIQMLIANRHDWKRNQRMKRKLSLNQETKIRSKESICVPVDELLLCLFSFNRSSSYGRNTLSFSWSDLLFLCHHTFLFHFFFQRIPNIEKRKFWKEKMMPVEERLAHKEFIL